MASAESSLGTSAPRQQTPEGLSTVRRHESPDQRIDQAGPPGPQAKPSGAAIRVDSVPRPRAQVAAEESVVKPSPADALRAWVRQSMGQESAQTPDLAANEGPSSDDSAKDSEASPATDSAKDGQEAVSLRPVDSLRAWVQAERVAMKAKEEAEAKDLR